MMPAPPPALVAEAPPRPAPAGAARDLRHFATFLEDQGETGGCGPTSLGMILSYWQDEPGSYHRRRIDREIRRVDVGTSPGLLARYARGQGYHAAIINRATTRELRTWLDRGVPVQLLIENGPRRGAGGFHFVAAVDYRTGPAGRLSHLVVADSWRGARLREIPREELRWRWGGLHDGWLATGTSRAMNVYLPPGDVAVLGRDGRVRRTATFPRPTDRGVSWPWAVGDAYFDAWNGLAAGRAWLEGARNLCDR